MVRIAFSVLPLVFDGTAEDGAAGVAIVVFIVKGFSSQHVRVYLLSFPAPHYLLALCYSNCVVLVQELLFNF